MSMTTLRVRDLIHELSKCDPGDRVKVQVGDEDPWPAVGILNLVGGVVVGGSDDPDDQVDDDRAAEEDDEYQAATLADLAILDVPDEPEDEEEESDLPAIYTLQMGEGYGGTTAARSTFDTSLGTWDALKLRIVQRALIEAAARLDKKIRALVPTRDRRRTEVNVCIKVRTTEEETQDGDAYETAIVMGLIESLQCGEVDLEAYFSSTEDPEDFDGDDDEEGEG